MNLRYYLIIGLYCTVLFWLSHQSRPPGAQIDFEGADKIAHFMVYGILAALVSLGLHRAAKQHSAPVRTYVPILFAALYGVSDEIHQIFTPGRSFSYLDMLANSLGAVTAQGLCLYRFRRTGLRSSMKEEGTG